MCELSKYEGKLSLTGKFIPLEDRVKAKTNKIMRWITSSTFF